MRLIEEHKLWEAHLVMLGGLWLTATASGSHCTTTATRPIPSPTPTIFVVSIIRSSWTASAGGTPATKVPSIRISARASLLYKNLFAPNVVGICGNAGIVGGRVLKLYKRAVLAFVSVVPLFWSDYPTFTRLTSK